MEDTINEFSKIFRSVSRIVKEKAEDYFGQSTPLDRVLREVSDPYTCSIPNSLLREIASAANDFQSYHPILHSVWLGLEADATQWRRIYKCLSLLEYLILLGPSRVYDDCKDASLRIRNLTNFRYHDGTREQGGGVRQKALSIIQFIDHPETIPAAREEAIATSQRYVGIENKPAFDFCAGISANRFAPTGNTWAELGGAFRNEDKATHPLSPNPYATMQQFQTAEDAARVWGVEMKLPPSLKREAKVLPRNSSLPQTSAPKKTPLPSDEEFFASGPDWWAESSPKEPADSETKVIAQNPPGAPKVITINLLDDDQAEDDDNKSADIMNERTLGSTSLTTGSLTSSNKPIGDGSGSKVDLASPVKLASKAEIVTTQLAKPAVGDLIDLDGDNGSSSSDWQC